MWLPILLGEQEADMQRLGMKMSAEDIYSVNKSSLKDAIVLFGSGCTGSIISDQGLLLTNHHCGASLIRQHSTPADNRLRDGYWAQSFEEELDNPGLKATFLVRMEDVTSQVLADLDGLTASERDKRITDRITRIELEATQGNHYEAEVKPFYYGNEYYLLVKEIFTDIRLVAAPPEAIGRYGGEADNWVWPRHNADFSLFRVYTGPDGKPAEYSPDNVPLTPRHHLPVSLKGVQPGDFTLVFGFPYRTQEYLPASAVAQLMEVEDPTRIKLRDLRLQVIQREMRANDTIRLMYASKESGISNGYKKWKGRLRGLKRNETLSSKRSAELRFSKLVAANEEWQDAYGDLLPSFEQIYAERAPLLRQSLYFTEGGYSIEAVGFCYQVLAATNNWQGSDNGQQKEILDKLRKMGQGHFREYLPYIDEEIMALILEDYATSLPPDAVPDVIKRIEARTDFHDYAANVFAQSALTDSTRFDALLKEFSPERLAQDPVYELFVGLYQPYSLVQQRLSRLNTELDDLMKRYMAAQRVVLDGQSFYPDANQSLRATYGQVEGMYPKDGVQYKPYTTLDGVMEKYIPGDYEFDLPQKLVELHAEGDYGRYGQDGELRVAFIASNHTSGGNSGSPVIDGEGRLIGLNFDRNWEGTMSDIDYDVDQCRNISVDVRYILFLIDKFGEANRLIQEMDLVR